MSCDFAPGRTAPDVDSSVPPAPTPGKRPWTPPRIDRLPALTELTLDSIQGDGSTSVGGGTVF